MRQLVAWCASLAAIIATTAQAVDVPVAAPKLKIIHKYRNYVIWDEAHYSAKDPAITKGAGTDPLQISATLRVQYANHYGKGEWHVPAGGEWLVNDVTIAKFYDPDAGGIFNDIRRTMIRQNRSISFVAWRLKGLDPYWAGDPLGPVYTAYCVTNGGEETCHCSQFSACTWNTFTAEFGGNVKPHEVSKLRCKRGVPDPTCRATCRNLIDQGATMLDGCSGLEWEKKDTAVGSGPDAANPHDVDNRYVWAGKCSLEPTVLCQPTVAAAALCAAETAGASGCGECDAGQGVCDPTINGAVTTVWDWLDGVNAAAFGGHTDWRLPTAGDGLYGQPGPSELASLADHLCGFLNGGWCPGAELGPVAVDMYWTKSTNAALSADAALATPFYVDFETAVSTQSAYPTKTSSLPVRAVRPAP